MFRACAFAVLASGCLSKPAIPVDGGPSDAQDAQDGPMFTDAAPACAGRTSFAADTILRRNVEVLDLDRRDGGNADDIVVWGREGVNGPAYAYILSGHPQMTGTCYDRRVPFLNASDVDPVDVFVGEMTGDAHPDLLMLGVETQQNDPRHEVILYPGDPTALVASTPASIRLPFGLGFQGPWGGNIVNHQPVFVLGWKQTAQPQFHAFAGGLYWHPATIAVTPSPLNFTSGLPATLAGDMPITMSAVQEVAVHTVPDPDELVFVVANDVFRVRYIDDASGHTFEIGGTAAIGSPGMRYARFARRPIDIAGIPTTLGITQHGTSGFQLLRIGGAFSTAPIVDHMQTPAGFADQAELAIGFTDANPAPDVVALIRDGSPGTLLQVHSNINFMQSPVAAMTFRELRLGDTGADRYNILAVGDFDGPGGLPDQIMVMSNAPAALPAKCYVLSGTIVPCP